MGWWIFSRKLEPSARRVYAFDFWVTLTDHAEVRELSRRLYAAGHLIHVVSAISPGLPLDSDFAYRAMLEKLDVPCSAIHRVDHVAAQKVRVLRAIKADGFWDDSPEYVLAARQAGIPTCHVGLEACEVLTLDRANVIRL
jgi:hypothetical protein